MYKAVLVLFIDQDSIPQVPESMYLVVVQRWLGSAHIYGVIGG